MNKKECCTFLLELVNATEQMMKDYPCPIPENDKQSEGQLTKLGQCRIWLQAELSLPAVKEK